MRDVFRDRERGEEAKYKLDEELQFKARCRRNKLVGRWAAERMGLTDDKAAAYASELISMALITPDADAVAGRVTEDFIRLGVKMEPMEIPSVVARCHYEAMDSLMSDYPTPLGHDHMQIGG